jgi:hypothetical protein
MAGVGARPARRPRGHPSGWVTSAHDVTRGFRDDVRVVEVGFHRSRQGVSPKTCFPRLSCPISLGSPPIPRAAERVGKIAMDILLEAFQ